MKLIVGLGNPGRQYEGTRHNVGFEIADALAERARISLSDKRFKARLGRGQLAGESVVVLEPETFMNLSGEAVGPCAGFFKIPTEDIVVIHDDLDLDVGRIKLKKGGGHGGHNGLRSMIKHLPDAEFLRVRVGVGRPPPEWDSADYVLSRFKGDERSVIDGAVRTAVEAVEAILRLGIRRAMTDYNRTVDEKSGARKEEE